MELDPSENRKAMKSARGDRSANGFEVVAREWFAKYSATWAATHSNRIIRRFEHDIFHGLEGDRLLADVTAPELLNVVRQRGRWEARTGRWATAGRCSRYAVATDGNARSMRRPARRVAPL